MRSLCENYFEAVVEKVLTFVTSVKVLMRQYRKTLQCYKKKSGIQNVLQSTKSRPLGLQVVIVQTVTFQVFK